MEKPIWITNEELRDLLKILAPARVVGGIVRNYLLGKQDSDVDIATIHLPKSIIQKARESNFKVIPTGLQHGTVTCVKKNTYEVTTLRIDVETDGRHAVVKFCDSWYEDAARRDLTINALYADLDNNIYDYFGGESDLRNKIIKFIGNPTQRIKEDYLRILRYFRFFALYGEKPDSASLEACYALRSGLNNIARERCTIEFLKLLDADDPRLALELLVQVLPYAGLPENDTFETFYANEQALKRKGTTIGRLAAFSSQHELKLSCKQKRELKLLHNMPMLVTLYDYVWFLQNVELETFWNGVLLKGQNNLAILDMLNPWLCTKFVVRAHDIHQYVKLEGRALGKKLQELKEYFCRQTRPLSTDELLKQYFKGEFT